MIALEAGWVTDRGRVRQANEDCALVTEDLFVVADGVGGHRAGEVASLTAVETVRASFNEATLDALVDAVQQANRAVWDKARSDPDLRGMGTTMCAVARVRDDDDEQLAVINVGDSRAYLLRQGELSQLTEDHSLVEEMVQQGMLTPEEALYHPQRSLITRALGLEPDVEVDHWRLIPYAGDRLLLCTDGLTNEVRDERIASTLRRLSDPQEAARDLLSQANTNGGNDNITVVIIDVVDDDEKAQRASAALKDLPATAGVASSRVEGASDRARDRAAPATRTRTVAQRARQWILHRPSWRAAAFSLAVVLVLVVAAAGVGWYARNTYFVGFRDDRVAIFQGRPGGLLWFDPTIKENTDLEREGVPPARRGDVESGKEFTSLDAARTYVSNLEDEATRLSPTTTAPTTTTPTTSSTAVVQAPPPTAGRAP
jgi:serine/threonine protein phosphatase PrpC